MKLISFAVPSYNSEAYLRHAIDTLLSGGEDVEIIIVNDGSKDGTAEIADSYVQAYPTIVKAIHKENGGHGSGVNCGVREAQGLYFKVVDSDDWVDEKALKSLLALIKLHLEDNNEPDVYFTNFVYNHVEDNTTFTRNFRRQLPVNKFFTWADVKKFHGSQLLLMHSVMFKTEIIRASKTVLPEHTFYVDNYFAFRPLPYCKKLFYADLDLYQYFIGRADQSVNINNLTRRYDQQIRVMRCIFDSYTYDEIMAMESGLRNYMLHTISAISMNTIMFSCCGGSDSERKEAYQEYLDHTMKKDPKLSKYIHRKRYPAVVLWMPWRMRGWAMLFGYKVLCKINKLG